MWDTVRLVEVALWLPLSEDQQVSHLQLHLVTQAVSYLDVKKVLPPY